MQAHRAASRRPGKAVHRELSGFDRQVAAVTRFSRRRAAEHSGGSFEWETTALELAANDLANRSEVHVSVIAGPSVPDHPVFPAARNRSFLGGARQAWRIKCVRV